MRDLALRPPGPVNRFAQIRRSHRHYQGVSAGAQCKKNKKKKKKKREKVFLGTYPAMGSPEAASSTANLLSCVRQPARQGVSVLIPIRSLSLSLSFQTTKIAAPVSAGCVVSITKMRKKQKSFLFLV